MSEYHKIQTVYLRDEENNCKTLLNGNFSKPEFEYLKDSMWEITEKVDGVNARVIWDMNMVSFKGKEEKTETPKFMVKDLVSLFPIERLNRVFPYCSAVLYGEYYGAKINRGNGYIPDGQSFILFDININGFWLDRKDVYGIAGKLGVKHVPIIAVGSLGNAINLCQHEFESELRDTLPEGIVARPMVELANKQGERIITKLKLKDF